MSRRILSVVVTVLGLVVIALAVCSATIWKPSSKVEATLASGPSQPYVITAPGVLSGTESDVTVTATSSDGKDVHLFVARAADVEAWLSPDADNALPYTVVTGIDADQGTLESKDETQYCPDPSATPAASAASTTQATAAASESGTGTQCSQRKASGVSASGSDLWLGEKTGGSSVTFSTADSDDLALLPRKNIDEQTVIMAMTDGEGQAPGLTVSWTRQVETPWYFYGGLVLGGLLVLAGVFLFFIDLQLRRADVERRTRSAERAARIANADRVSTEGIPQVDDPDRRLTRRELREKERAESAGEAWTDPRTGRVYQGGFEAPSVPQAPEAVADDGIIARQDEAVAGVMRGSAVVPGLDETTTQAYRASRGFEDGAPLTIAADEAEAAGTSGYGGAPALPGLSGTSQGGDVGPEPYHDASYHSRFAPQDQHGGHPVAEQDAQHDTAEITGLATPAPVQDPGPQVPAGTAHPEPRPWPAADQTQPGDARPLPTTDQQWPEANALPQNLSAEAAQEAPSSISTGFTTPTDPETPPTTVSWPSYSDGVELPPAVDPAAVQAADAEPLGEPDNAADPHNQENA